MLKVLIVDDEYLVVSGLINCIDWYQIGVDTPISSRNGEEALTIMASQRIDILITDIAMAPMDGISLMCEVRCRGYDTEIIVLSCHNDFEYSRKALQNGACDFLFKPEMMPDEITKAVINARDSLLRKRNNSEKLSKLENQAVKNRESVIQQFLTDIIDGKNITREVARQQFNGLKMPIPFSNLQVIVLKTSVPTDQHEFKDEAYLLHYGICNTLEETLLNYSGVLMSRSQSEYIMLVDDRLETKKLAKEIVSIVQNIFNLYCSCGLSDVGFSLENIRMAYEQANTMADRLFVLGLDKVGRFGEDITSDNKGKLMKQVLNIIYSIDEKPFTEKLKTIFIRLHQEKQVDLPFLNEISAQMFVQLMKGTMLSREALRYLYDKQGEMFSKLITLTNIDQFERYVLQIASDVEKISKINCRDEIYEAKNYIIENMSDVNLSIEQVARHVNLSKNYFSHLFKKNTGQTFIEFLTEMRVERAAELYKTSRFKIYQIAEMVGYMDWRYFTKVFKKLKGKNLTNL